MCLVVLVFISVGAYLCSNGRQMCLVVLVFISVGAYLCFLPVSVSISLPLPLSSSFCLSLSLFHLLHGCCNYVIMIAILSFFDIVVFLLKPAVM